MFLGIEIGGKKLPVGAVLLAMKVHPEGPDGVGVNFRGKFKAGGANV